jgi:hypothetical protein
VPRRPRRSAHAHAGAFARANAHAHAHARDGALAHAHADAHARDIPLTDEIGLEHARPSAGSPGPERELDERLSVIASDLISQRDIEAGDQADKP